MDYFKRNKLGELLESGNFDTKEEEFKKEQHG